jgi:hypothetical protein
MKNAWGKKRTACRILVEKPEGKRLFGRFRRRWIKKSYLCERPWRPIEL